MKARSIAAWAIAWATLAGADCKCEKSEIGKIINTFGKLGMGEEAPEEKKPAKPKEYRLRHWAEDVAGGRSRALANIEVEYSIDRDRLETVLRDACHDDDLLRGSAVVKVVAWPGSIEKLARPLGISVFARDGHGWEGDRVGFENIEIYLPSPAQMQQQKIAPISEREYLQILGVDRLLREGKTEEDAVAATAERHSVSADEIRASLDHASRLWGRPVPKKAPAKP